MADPQGSTDRRLKTLLESEQRVKDITEVWVLLFLCLLGNTSISTRADYLQCNYSSGRVVRAPEGVV